MMPQVSTEQREALIKSIEEILASEKEIDDLAATEVRLECPKCLVLTVVPAFEFYERATVQHYYRCTACQVALVSMGNDPFAVQMAGMLYAMKQGQMTEEQVRDGLSLLLRLIKGGV
jgi:hypothetical protein